MATCDRNKYGHMWGSWCSNEVKGDSGMGLWKSVRMGWGEFVKHVKYKIARLQDASVADSLSFLSNSMHWSVDFVRNVNDWEVTVISDFLRRLYELKIVQGSVDSLSWIHERNSRFSVHSYYHVLTCQGVCDFPWKSIWKVKVTNKVAFFCWFVSHDKILTIENLRKHGICIVDWCYMCNKDSESVIHLFLHCEVAKSLWNVIFGRLGISWVMPKQVVNLIAGWK
ncbi:hypothetical protein F2P56_028501 [Juglans regia]|uniref:Reverse transcriptase zinc-binding domain-containing protein n=1 Tax=Juglans regia TaxID=51240 RepID=A0A833WK94_JUGRE|nr:hypothetical protein F2P56_028501 [Juglans regia]